ncbi:MAG: Gmad2 immunoglobulin-like domain-containing protein [Dehalococcoidia bacterium]|nr:Gmad2 immunoglobulin-like domain-containing protein [Dehalococcoidia bacterium]
MLHRLRRALALVPICALVTLSACVASSGAAKPAPKATVGPISIIPGVPAPKATTTPQPAPFIVVTAPIAGLLVKSPVHIAGSAQVFEGTVSLAVKDAAGKVLAQGHTQAGAGAPLRGPFSADIAFTQPITAQAGTIEVYSISPKDGSTRDLVSIKVTLAGR